MQKKSAPAVGGILLFIYGAFLQEAYAYHPLQEPLIYRNSLPIQAISGDQQLFSRRNI
jgi:hypothetical protein